MKTQTTTTEAKVAKAPKILTHETAILKVIEDHGFKSYYDVTKRLNDAGTKTYVSVVRSTILKLEENGKFNREATKQEILTVKDVTTKYGTTRVTPKIDRELVAAGYTKMKSAEYPFRVTYVK